MVKYSPQEKCFGPLFYLGPSRPKSPLENMGPGRYKSPRQDLGTNYRASAPTPPLLSLP
jgi:hypothetical protein